MADDGNAERMQAGYVGSVISQQHAGRWIPANGGQSARLAVKYGHMRVALVAFAILQAARALASPSPCVPADLEARS